MILKRRIVLVVPGFWRLSGGAAGRVVVRDILGSCCRDLGVVEFWLVFGWRKVLIWVIVAAAVTSGGGRCFG